MKILVAKLVGFQDRLYYLSLVRGTYTFIFIHVFIILWIGGGHAMAIIDVLYRY
jgi:hypothetical protein